VEFDWDPNKAASNERKHGIRLSYAIGVFLDLRVVDYDVSRLDDNEPRRKAVGMIDGRLFTVVYTMRGEVIRIISGRRANVQESREYALR